MFCHPNQPFVLVSACTGKAVSGVNGITWHFAFHVLVKPGLKSSGIRSQVTKLQYLKVLIIDEISMIGRETFGQLNQAIKAFMQNFLPFERIYLLVVNFYLLTKKLFS